MRDTWHCTVPFCIGFGILLFHEGVSTATFEIRPLTTKWGITSVSDIASHHVGYQNTRKRFVQFMNIFILTVIVCGRNYSYVY